MKVIGGMARSGWLGTIQIGIKARRYVEEVTLPDLLVAGDVTNLYQSHGFNTEPRCAMLVEVEEKVSEKNCFRNGQNSSSEPMVSTQNLDGPRMRILE
jgi:hypothetical protein